MKKTYLFFLLLFTYQVVVAQCYGTQGEVRWRYWEDITLITWSLADYERLERYPNGPDYVRTINSLATPTNYNDNYGTLVSGYIRSTTGGQAKFSVTGDDEYEFYLSTDNTPNNLVLLKADSNDIANLDIVTLAPNQYYYFELKQIEFGGGDYALVQWKADFLSGGMNASEWTTVGGDYIYDICDTFCNPQGTACTDNNANTQNDQEDGNCNCVGNPITTNACVGERGVVQGYIYDGIGGNYELTTLNNALTNNVQPDEQIELGTHFWNFIRDGAGGHDDFGIYLQAYLKVPVSGYYTFNLTGGNENIFYLSSDDSPDNKTATVLRNNWWTDIYGHEVGIEEGWNPGQTSATLLLDANQYYYVELHHRGTGTWEFFSLFWKTPYQTSNDWMRIPTFHLFDYACETVCVKAGKSCNDQDPYTANDQWDGNCNCTGTPCTAPNCDDSITSYNTPASCETTNLLDNRADDTWLSCAPLTDAPNPQRNGQHWIQYDFGELYNISTTQIWNYNAYQATNLGFQQAVIDYSTDGIYWQELGTYNWSLASGSATYEGFAGPNFSNITAQYVLISSLDNPNSCRGLSKVAFTAIGCPKITFVTPQADANLMAATDIPVTLSVTDGDAAITKVDLYLNDAWIASDNTAPYNWSGVAALQNLPAGDYELSAVAIDANGTECELTTLIHIIPSNGGECQSIPLVLTTTEEAIYRTSQTITSSSIIASTDNVNYLAGQSITLTAGFHAEGGSNFTARIEDCTPTSLIDLAQSRITNSNSQYSGKNEIELFPNPVQTNFTIAITAYQADELHIQIYNVLGKNISNLSRQQKINKGRHKIELSAATLTSGLYYCQIKIGKEVFTKSFVRVNK